MVILRRYLFLMDAVLRARICQRRLLSLRYFVICGSRRIVIYGCRRYRLGAWMERFRTAFKGFPEPSACTPKREQKSMCVHSVDIWKRQGITGSHFPSW